jgi:hypothetical protein
MEDRLVINGLWDRRDEHIDDCVRKVNATFRGLAQLAQDWAEWYRAYQTMKDRERGPTRIVDEHERIREELLRGRILNPDGRPQDDLGCWMRAWAGAGTGKGLEHSHFQVQCCVTSEYQRFNAISIELPVRRAAPILYDCELLSRAVVLVADLWNPDWVAVWSLRDESILVKRPWEGGPVLGWVNYFPVRTGAVATDLPRGWHWFAGRGEKQVFIHDDGPPDPNKPTHCEEFADMRNAIRWGKPPTPQ